MKLINVGFGNMVNGDRLVAVVSGDSAPVKRAAAAAKERGTLVDATYGRRTKSVLIMDSGHVVLSALGAEALSDRASGASAGGHSAAGPSAEKSGVAHGE